MDRANSKPDHAPTPRWRGVITTGIYCWATCGSRPPLTENIRHFYSAEEAQRAGFRPCRRCRPDRIHPDQRKVDIVAEACRLIEQSASIPKVGALAKMFDMSEGHFHRIFRKQIGLSPRAYALEKRAAHVRRELGQSRTITELIYETGHSSSGHFYALVERALGMTPKNYKRGGDNETLRFTVAPTRLGAIAVASSDRGLSCLFLGDDEETVLEDLREQFPNSELVNADLQYKEAVVRILNLVHGQCSKTALPPDINSTAFQRRLWRALQHTTLAPTLTHEELEMRVADPRVSYND